MTGENPAEGLQKMLWKGLTKEKDKDAELPDLESEVFQVLVETLPSADFFAQNGLSIQLSSLLPRMIDKYTAQGQSEQIAARKASSALRVTLAENQSHLSRQGSLFWTFQNLENQRNERGDHILEVIVNRMVQLVIIQIQTKLQCSSRQIVA